MKQILTLCAILLLAGCAGSEYGTSLWNSTPAAPAEAAPSSLQAPPAPVPALSVAGAQQPPASQNFPTTVSGATAPAAPVKVALLVPLSGAHADMGQALSQAAQLALFDMGSHSFELMPRDTGSSPAMAQKAAEGAITDGAQLILGPLFAPQVKAVGPLAGRYGVNMVAFSTDWTLAGGNGFIMGFVPFGQVQRIVQYAASQGVRHVGVLVPAGEYGDAVLSAYNAEASHDGIATIATERVPASGDLSAPVARVAHTPGLDAVLIAVGGPQARAIANLLITDGVGPDVRRLGTGLWDDTSLASEPALQGAWFAAPAPDLRAAFEKRYFDTYGGAAPRLATLAYDATALAAVLSRVDQSSDRHPFDRTALTNPNGFAGVDGVFRFLPNGLAERGLAILTYRQNAIAVQDPAPRTFQQWRSQ